MWKGRWLSIFLRECYTCKLRSDLNINSDEIECLCIEILNKYSKSLILNLSYRPPQSDTTLFEKNLQDLLSKNDICKKEILIKGDFNINLLDYENNKKVQPFVNLMFRCGMVPAINKPTHVTRYSATAIDPIITISIINTEIKSAIIKAGISDHFPIIFVAKVNVDVSIRTEQYILKRNICDQSIKKFKQKWRDVIWDDIKITDSVNHSYNRFLQIFLSLYNEYLPKIKSKLNPQKHFRPRITLGIRKSSKRKQRLYEKCFKTRNAKSEAEYKAYKNLLGIIKPKSQRKYYSQKILEYKNHAKNHGIL